MLSRVAENIYWMQRYRERAENIARYIDVNLNLMLDMPQDDETQWAPFVQITGDYRQFIEKYGSPTKNNVIQFLVFDAENPNSLLSCLKMARENARTVRAIITKDMWHELNTTYLFVQRVSEDRSLMRTPHQFYQRIRRQLQLFTYFSNSCMLQDEGWHFGRIGFLVERADQISRLLDVKYFLLLPSPEYIGTPYDNIQWGAMLKSVGALEMYRQKWNQIDASRVTDFLLLSREFPRALHFCILEVKKSLKAISGARYDRIMNMPDIYLQMLLQKLDNVSVEAIIEKGLHEYVDEMQYELKVFGDSLYETFFTPVLSEVV